MRGSLGVTALTVELLVELGVPAGIVSGGLEVTAKLVAELGAPACCARGGPAVPWSSRPSGSPWRLAA